MTTHSLRRQLFQQVTHLIGRYTMSHQGSPATWIPGGGDYIIVVEANPVGDSDAGNDYSRKHNFSSRLDRYHRRPCMGLRQGS